MFADFLKSLAAFSTRHTKKIALIAILSLIPGGILLKSLKIEPRLLDIEDIRGPEFKHYRDNYKRFGDSTPMVLLQRHEGIGYEVRNRFTRALVDKIRKDKEIISVQAGLVDLSATEDAIRMIRAALFNEPEKYLSLFSRKFSPQDMKKEMLRTRKRLIAADHPEWRESMSVDVLNIRQVLQPRYLERMGNFHVSPNSSFFDSSDHTVRLIFAQPRGSGEDKDYCQSLTTRIRQMIEETRESIPGAEAISCQFAGKYGLTAEASVTLNREMAMINGITALLIFTLLIIVFQNWKATLLCFLPILFSVFASLLVARIFFNPLKLVSVGFAAILIGMGIDITFHLCGRFFQYYQVLPSRREAVIKTMRECGPPVIIGIVTTAAAFFILNFSSCTALRQMGTITGISLVLTLVLSLLLFPAIVGIIKPTRSDRILLDRIGGIPRLFYKPALRRKGLSRIGAGLLILVAAVAAVNLDFDMRLFELLPQKLESMQNAREAGRHFGSSFLLNTQLTLETDDLQRGIAFQKQLDRKLEDLVRQKRIAGFYSPTLFYVPPELDPAYRQQFLVISKQVKEGRTAFFRLLQASRFSPDSRHGRYYDMLENIFDGAVLHKEDQISDIRLRQFIRKEKNLFYLQTYIWPVEELSRVNLLLKVTEDLKKISPPQGMSLNLTGTYQVYRASSEMIRKDFQALSLWGAAVVMLILFLFFRRIQDIILSLLPLLGAIPVTLAFIVISKTTFSPFLIAVVAVIIGIGIDDAVHLVYRRSLAPDRERSLILHEIAPVLTLTTLTTAIGFSALYLSSSPLVSAMGAVVGFGVIAAWLFTMFLLPTFLTRGTQ